MLPLDEQFSQLAEDAPIRTFVKALPSQVLKRLVAPDTRQGVDARGRATTGWLHLRRNSKQRIFYALSARSAFPAHIEGVFDGLGAAAASPQMPQQYVKRPTLPTDCAQPARWNGHLAAASLA